ncbi:sensor histidine kinase [Streptomyces justiciae]|uniref:sensor histidine kinase n=1 Tax=Streptomyces justiciae TaxID=2780140 RepID=UPI00187E7661|nr:PAS domain-containing protein [Streptomyces justiciae]MBE8478309.1 PAS domain-containing protein [Streptomyces justiciae]MCW8384432.1 PAS domain-containing protein [Streptomyces justiciae]
MTSIAGDWGSVFDVIRQPVWAVDAAHLVRYANRAAAEAMGYDDPAQLLGLDGRPSPAADLDSGGGALTRIDGTLLPVEWNRMPLPGTGGEADLYVFRPLDAEPRLGGRSPGRTGPLYRRLAHRQAERDRRHARVLQHEVQERMVRTLLGLNIAREELTAVPAQAAGLLSDAVRDTEEALAGVREVTDALCPGALRAGGLPAALAALARRRPSRTTVSGTFSERLPELVETHAYLLVAEAVERAVDHGGADHVHVTADHGPDGTDSTDLVVTVADDGTEPVTGADLAALNERVAALDGTLTVRHIPGTGTTVTVIVPSGPADTA